MSWSFGLLDERLQRTFADLSVFAGSFTAADAAAICGVDAETATAALHQLAERSLVMRAPDRRFVLLETLRAFGAEQLAADGRAEEVGERHARHQVDWIERRRPAAGRGLAGPAVIAEIDAAIPELRAALGWLLDHDQVELAGRLVGGPARLRVPAAAARRAGVGGAGDGRPTPTTAARWRRSCGSSAPTPRGWPATCARPARAAGAPCGRASGSAARCRRSVATSCGSYELFEGRLGGGGRLVPARRRRGGRRSGATLGRGERRGARPGLRGRPDRASSAPTSCWPRSARRALRTPPTRGTAPVRPTCPSTSSGRGPASLAPSSWPSARARRS